ncbi:hypothetical protein KAX08_06255 [candidate division WOR-3 bacterium]|nr:hypothetical protein [candidate division WOR-3 bacterium]
MLIFLLFLAIDVDGEFYIQIDHRSSSNNLFFLDEGFINPGAGYGIIGADINPAVLASTRNFDFYTGFSLTGEGSFDFDDTMMVGGIVEQIEVTFGTNYRELGGIDFFGVSKRIGPVSIGICRPGGNKWGIEAGLSGSVSGDFNPEDPIELTHGDHPEIPEEDTIIVNLPISGGIFIDTPEPLRIEYSSSPIFIGAGTGFGPVKVGVGLKFTKNRILGKGSITVRPDTFSILVDTVVRSPSGDYWTVDSLVGYAVINDTLYYGNLDGDISTTQTAFDLGVILDTKILKLSLAYEYGTNYTLTGDYEWLFREISGFPEVLEFDTSGLQVDSINNIISGSVGVIFNEIPKETNSEIGISNLHFAGYHSLRGGVQLDLFLLRLGLNGSIDFPTSGDIRLSRLDAGLSFGVPIPVLDVNMGLAGSLIWLDTEDEDFFLPSVITGLSISYKQDNFRVDLPIKINITQPVLSRISGVLDVEEFDLWGNISLGLGIGISL